MWIVRLALRRPYTFVVAAMLIVFMGAFAIRNMATDIFPSIDIPVISVIFNYTGMSPEDMEKRIVSPYERILTTTVNDIHHTESQSLYGVSVTKIYFQPNAKIDVAIAQVTAVSQTAIRQMPPGTQPPLVIQYNAASVPILQLSLGSDTMTEQALFDTAVNYVRPQLVGIPGIQIPYPYGGKQRQVVVDLDPEKLYSYGLSPADVSATLASQNLILPGGTTKIGTQEYQVYLNSSPDKVAELNDLPITTRHGTTIHIKDVAHVRDGFQVQTNVVHTGVERGGKRGVLLSIMKAGNASTLDVVDNVKKALPGIMAGLPAESKDLKINLLLDQSVFVRASVEGVVKEAAIAAGLTALMILLFLGSWRSMLIVVVSIPLSIAVSIIVLWALGQTLNVMTLGGMALAVGILVDDATVGIENIHRNLHMGKRLVTAILDGSEQIAVPAFVSTICICIVFVPVVFISGAAKYLFTPLAMAVVFAMLTSYLLSRTLMPTMVHFLLAGEVERYGGVLDAEDPHAVHALHAKEAREHGLPVPAEDEELEEKIGHWLKSGVGRLVMLLTGTVIVLLVAAIFMPLTAKVPHLKGLHDWAWRHWRTLAQGAMLVALCVPIIWLTVAFHGTFNKLFEKLQRVYGGFLAWALDHKKTVAAGFMALVIVSLGLMPLVGEDFFPTVDAGQMRLHVRCPPGTRIEETAVRYAAIEEAIRELIPQEEIATMLDDMGIPNSGINLSLSDGSMMSPADGEILISLKEHHRPTAEYQRMLRKELPKRFPAEIFSFASADIVTQVLNFGLAAPVDIQVMGNVQTAEQNSKIAAEIAGRVATVPGVVDVHLAQVPHAPDLRLDVDRTLASHLGVTQKDVASDVLISLSSSSQVSPNFWLNRHSGANYSILVQTPQYLMGSLNALQNTPIPPSDEPATAQNTQVLANLATLHRGVSPTNITHYNIFPTYDVLLNVQGRDLGSTAADLQKIVDQVKDEGKLPAGTHLLLRGQVESMHSSFFGLGVGLVFAVVLVYLLMVVNFQSWLDPLIILMALPGAMAGILWMLWVSSTPISVPALMGAIMSIGVATANSILMITFANDQRKLGMTARDAALLAGLTRLRPVIMTALAMIIGMLPMSLGLGEGGEQNAPLGRAVIGGLSVATFATLLFVPVVYSMLRRKAPQLKVEPELM
jgi:multidrug efflux pump subunit AcrB